MPAVLVVMLIGLAVAARGGYGAVPALALLGLALFVGCYFGLLQRIAQQASLRWSVAFLFGLVHGFGFAAVLGEAGLPSDRVAAALFGFNFGVEIGQLAVVMLVWPVLRWLAHRHASRHRLMVETSSAAIAGLGMFWFVSRAFG
jgi:hypothetical protein